MENMHSPEKLDNNSLRDGVNYLCKEDPNLADVIAKFGYPPLWAREPGFPTLIHIILEQQVSLASAKAAFNKLNKASGKLTPERFLEFSDADLKEYGFSRQKTKYGRELSKSVLEGQLDLLEIDKLDDSSARNELIKVKGIGPWTADIYLLMALRRPDIWPTGDLALEKAVQKIKSLNAKPTSQDLKAIVDKWKPWRAVAARIVWHFYLSRSN